MVARRALTLFGVWSLTAREAPRDEVLKWIELSGLQDALSPAELAFVSASPPSRKQITKYSWHSERLVVLRRG